MKPKIKNNPQRSAYLRLVHPLVHRIVILQPPVAIVIKHKALFTPNAPSAVGGQAGKQHYFVPIGGGEIVGGAGQGSGAVDRGADLGQAGVGQFYLCV